MQDQGTFQNIQVTKKMAFSVKHNKKDGLLHNQQSDVHVSVHLFYHILMSKIMFLHVNLATS